jgi:HAD superfamily hydrolase (TIGR01509 family)
MDLKLVIFDMDGLIFDSEKVYFKANQMAAKELKVAFSFAYYRQFVGAGTKRMIDQLAKDYGSRQLAETFIKISHQNVFKIVQKDGLPLKKGFLQLTAFLKAHQIKQVLASSSDRPAIKLFLQSADLLQNFDQIVSGEDVTEAKPAPAIFEKAWKKAGAPRKVQCLVLEDSINGIRAADNAQLPAIMVPDLLAPTPEMKQKAIAILPDLNAVCQFIQK